MSMGERIYQLRTARNLSQEELADVLEVSRQSVSKWETNGSVPELDKLVKLCELFDVTMDYLVRDRSPEETAAAPVSESGPARTVDPRDAKLTLGIALPVGGIVTLLTVTVLFGIRAGLLLGGPFILVGVVCLLMAMRRGVRLACLWVLWVVGYVCLRTATGVRLWSIFMPGLYRTDMWAHLCIAWVAAVSLVLLAAATWRILKRRKVEHETDV